MKEKALPLTDDAGLKTLKKLLMSEVKKLGVTEVSRRTGMPRTHFYRMLCPEGNPSLESIMKLSSALGLKLSIGKY